MVRWSARRKAHAGAYLVDTQFTVHDAWAVIHAVRARVLGGRASAA